MFHDPDDPAVRTRQLAAAARRFSCSQMYEEQLDAPVPGPDMIGKAKGPGRETRAAMAQYRASAANSNNGKSSSSSSPGYDIKKSGASSSDALVSVSGSGSGPSGRTDLDADVGVEKVKCRTLRHLAATPTVQERTLSLAQGMREKRSYVYTK